MFGFVVECKRKDILEDNLFYVKVNAISDIEALREVREYLVNDVNSEVVKIDKTYNIPFAGVIN